MQEKLKTKVEGSVLQMEWTFNAPRELVFAAFTEKEHLEAWWGPEGWQTEITTFDFVEGGIWHYCMRCKDPAQGEFY
ncbi:SRPBCC domain-containing protein, partial [Bacteroides uniformis]|uniref:SRPBCC domain-containing protein n=2 Tax=Bacteria TaxID=2 RepID=UPI001EDD6F2F